MKKQPGIRELTDRIDRIEMFIADLTKWIAFRADLNESNTLNTGTFRAQDGDKDNTDEDLETRGG